MKTRIFPSNAFVVGAQIEANATQPAPSDKPGAFAVKIVARSPGAVDVPFMGPVIHDFAGMNHKAAVTIDYQHDPQQVIGVADGFDISDTGALLTGRLIPFSADDTASKVIHGIKSGIPYEASIYFPPSRPDDVMVEELGAGQVAQVNGQQVTGPMAVIRKWSLRGVAVTPYGMDSATATLAAMSDNKTEYSVSVADAKHEENTSMDQEKPPAPPAMSEEKKDEGMEFDIECPACKCKSKVKYGADKSVVVEKYDAPPKTEDQAREEATAMCAEFGDEFGMAAWRAKRTIEQARTEFTAKIKADLSAMAAKVKDLESKLAAPGFQPSGGEAKTAYIQLSDAQRASVDAYCKKCASADREVLAVNLLKKK